MCATTIQKRHLLTLSQADARLIFDSEPQICCIWADDLATRAVLQWSQLLNTFELPDEWSQRIRRLRLAGLDLQTRRLILKWLNVEIRFYILGS